jgi:hypothetical protein
MDEGLTKEIQMILQRSGRPSSSVGVYDAATREAFRALCGEENLENRWRDGPEVDRVVLQYLRQRFPSPSGRET